MTVRELITACGGITRVARANNAPFSTVYNWIYKNKIPAWRVTVFREMAIANNVNVTDEFWESISQKQPKGGK